MLGPCPPAGTRPRFPGLTVGIVVSIARGLPGSVPAMVLVPVLQLQLPGAVVNVLVLFLLTLKSALDVLYRLADVRDAASTAAACSASARLPGRRIHLLVPGPAMLAAVAAAAALSTRLPGRGIHILVPAPAVLAAVAATAAPSTAPVMAAAQRRRPVMIPVLLAGIVPPD